MVELTGPLHPTAQQPSEQLKGRGMGEGVEIVRHAVRATLIQLFKAGFQKASQARQKQSMGRLNISPALMCMSLTVRDWKQLPFWLEPLVGYQCASSML
jgi:hypothetical protein